MTAGRFGHFLEISLRAPVISASAAFYGRLGLRALATGDVYAHRYGVYSDGRVHLGLHEGVRGPATLSCVLPELASALPHLRSAQFSPVRERLGCEDFHRVEFADPAGTPVRLLEARTYSPAAGTHASQLGRFTHWSLPVRDRVAVAAWWERAGWIAWPECAEPYVHVPLTGDQLDLALHSPQLLDAPCLVFSAADMAARIAALRAAGETLEDAPRGLDRRHNALLVAPEGTLLLLLTATD
ncbi:MAG: hypothetical protein IT480_07980 [Gammaproteobacteria bacterium]|nr:hypothetical protein [Gammaproteobacteria bacterium]